MKIARFEHVSANYQIPWFFDEKRASFTDMTRTSEWIDVEFPPRASEEVVPEALAAIDKQIEACRVENHRRCLAALEERRANLLALPQRAADLEAAEAAPF